MSILRFDDLKAVPWKNGLGMTREIAVEPAGASMDDFLWRASIADVDTASPFSRFPGVDRTIVLLQGDGFTMTLDAGHEHALTTPCVPFAFPGEAAVEVTLAGGATRDFNLMVRRGKASGTINVVYGPNRLEADDVALLHVARGTAVVDGVACAPGDTLTAPCKIELADEAAALLVRIKRNDT
ncbi:HutD/Ves family protein [Luteibacter yeojuensis]|uniref:HutD family protein n=1 Tax=Luteibacter yeojuensis TaxID=345309 RepID=A0A7X5TSS5_9GAMM|nr:HutD family protein [Luteibacter yeojuensis]NID17492.1 HutD family protein [Luteibacter yeojuensis]